MHKPSSYLIVALLALPLVLNGCASKPRLEIDIAPVTKKQLNLPSPDAVLQNPVYWMALARKAPAGQKGSIEHFWQEMEAKGYSTALAISPADFRKLSKNNAALRRYILQQKAIIKAYKKYYNENK